MSLQINPDNGNRIVELKCSECDYVCGRLEFPELAHTEVVNGEDKVIGDPRTDADLEAFVAANYSTKCDIHS